MLRSSSRHVLIGLLLAGMVCETPSLLASPPPRQPEIGARSAPVLTIGGLRFRDLDRDGKLTPYEDWRLSPDRRAADLVARMTLEEKAGAMMHPVMGKPDQITLGHVNSVLSRSSRKPTELAAENNAFQEVAAGTRLGIPVTISTDPRNGFTATFGMSVDAKGFSSWPDALGLAATRDAALVRNFAAIAAREYRAVGFTMALSPQADIASDPRWSRTSGTFGDDPRLVGALAAAYIEGMQGGSRGIAPGGVAAVVKHFAGYGAIKDGWDSHSRYGRFATFPGGRLDQHIAAFRPSFRAKVAGVMPMYSIIDAPGHPPVAAGYDKVLLTDILRRREGFGGLVLSDWSITENCSGICLGEPMTAGSRDGLIGKPWGVEHLTRAERVIATVQAGVDQIGYDASGAAIDATPIVEAVKAGTLPEARVDLAVQRIMRIKFALGLFENPYVDAAQAAQVVGQAPFRAAALAAQQRSLVLLENKGHILPLRPAGKRVFLHGIAAEAARQAGFTVVDRLDDADLAIIRAVTPWQVVHPNYLFGRMQHEGDLDFKPDNADLKAIREASAKVPTIVTVYLERPAILTGVRPLATALIGNFGASDEALLSLVSGRVRPRGKLPMELPSSMAAANAQQPDVPHDSAAPLYRSGYGLTF